ncbi:MAG: hypothetical protein IJC89_04700 [Clostridia bacterium]|nr:hypothetical protein [Clostridia bacterium]
MRIFKRYGDDIKQEIIGKESEKKGLFLYFELLIRKFWKYVTLNLLYSFSSVVNLVIYWFVSSGFFVPLLLSSIPEENWKRWADASNGMPVEQFYGAISFFTACLIAFLLVLLFGGGVFSAGYNYVLRNYARQENSFMLSDYFAQTKNNFTQSLVVSVIDIIVLTIAMFSGCYYFSLMNNGGGTFAVIAFAIVVFALLIYAVMHTYMWTMLVTFKISIKQLFKNAFLLTFGAALNSILYIVILVIYTFISTVIFAYNWVLAGGIFIVIGFTAFNLAGHLISYPVIKKYMIGDTKENEEGKK